MLHADFFLDFFLHKHHAGKYNLLVLISYCVCVCFFFFFFFWGGGGGGGGCFSFFLELHTASQDKPSMGKIFFISNKYFLPPSLFLEEPFLSDHQLRQFCSEND